MRFAGTLVLFALAALAPLPAQEHVAPAAGPVPDSVAQLHGAAAPKENVDIITPHITDSHELEVPYWRAPFYKVVHLPIWPAVHIGPLTLDLSPTKHVIMLLLAATLTAAMLLYAAALHGRQHRAAGRPSGLANGIEAMVLYLRNEVVMPNVGHHGEKYVPFVLTLFFFILFANLLGLIPYGSTATGNISVTATLAIITFIVIEISGMRALGRGYLKTIIYWPDDQPLAMKAPMTLIMTPIEIIGKFTKPFALAIRLFANMTAGHIVVLAFIGLIFFFGSLLSIAPFFMAVGIMMLEIFVSFLQAYIFSLLASVFIGQIRESHH